ncbi:MAG: insulinase family protein, partial [Spirochaetales bacterium]|nr:insulinase family protein [Spirochaetales bacterium]
MKKLLPILFLVTIFSCTSTGSIGSKNKEDPVPFDSEVEHGVLENGLEYFIRPNSEPQNRIVLRLVINAGSILEDEDQLGLAHLIEHMAFNGTANFEKHEIINYLESTGMKFGADTNAHTSFDETVYKINIPPDNPDMLQTGLEILKEWAFEIAFEDEEIDKERGVVIEEWRSGRGADARMRDEYFSVLFSESLYGDRMPIGDMEVVKNSSYDTIKRFYKDWYRPELMAVIVVGEVDPSSVKISIDNIFGNYNNGSNPRLRKEFPVPDNSTRLYSIVSDTEAAKTNLQIIYKNDSTAGNTVNEYRTS